MINDLEIRTAANDAAYQRGWCAMREAETGGFLHISHGAL